MIDAQERTKRGFAYSSDNIFTIFFGMDRYIWMLILVKSNNTNDFKL